MGCERLQPIFFKEKERMSLIKTIDGNEAAAHSAFMTNEVICIYPITPSSTMAELSDDWASKAQTNIWHEVPRVVEM